MRILLTWSDRGADGPTPKHHRPRPASDRGPVMRLVEQPDIPAYDAAHVLCTSTGRDRAETLATDLRQTGAQAQVSVLPVADPSDHTALFEALSPVLAALPTPADIDVVLSAFTPQSQTLWVLLSLAGLLERGGRTRLLQVIPSVFVPDPHPRPWRPVQLDIDTFPDVRGLKAELLRLRAAQRVRETGLVGESPAMDVLRRRIGRVGTAEVPVLVLGETGTGKELVARAVHAASRRAAGPFIAESCASLADGVLQSELFGHERGAFTGAAARKRGLFELAHGGTLFLDEVGELTPRVQALLLRVLQEGVVRRVGGERPVRVDVRVLAATHRDLAAMVAAGTFRQDLYYRLRGATLHLPPLRERSGDVRLLVQHFLGEVGRRDLRLTAGAAGALEAWSWPGNVRELRAEVIRWTVFCDGRVGVADLSPELRGGAPTVAPVPGAEGALPTLPEAVAALEDRLVAQALARTGGNKSAAARLLGIDRNTLKRKLPPAR